MSKSTSSKLKIPISEPVESPAKEKEYVIKAWNNKIQKGIVDNFPYSIAIINASSDQHVWLFGSPNMESAPKNKFEDKLLAIISNTPGVTYQDLLWEIMVLNPPTIGLTYVSLRHLGPPSENKVPWVSRLTIKKAIATGTTTTEPRILQIDPFQNRTNIYVSEEELKLDGQTIIGLTMPAESRMDIDMYRVSTKGK